jgi:hypothetical protein
MFRARRGLPVPARLKGAAGVCVASVLAAVVSVGEGAAQQFVDTGAAITPVGHSAADWGDYDRDGDLDLLLCGFAAAGELTKLMRNDAGTLVDSGIAFDGVSGGAVRWGDYDRDGDLDLVLMGIFDPFTETRIYRNDGAALFTDIGAGLIDAFQCDAAWVDLDADGDLDLTFGGTSLGTGDVFKIYRNDGADSFVDVPTTLPSFHRGSVDWADYDLDGDPDLVMTGLSGGFIPRSRLFRNDGDGVFTLISTPLFHAYDGAARWGDFDADGDPDILLTGTGESFSEIVTHVYRNDAGLFTELGQDLEGAGEGSSIGWGDSDGDGDLDFAATAVFFGGTAHFRNEAGTFIQGGSELRDMCCGALAWADFDGDTDLDLFLSGLPTTSKLYRNVLSAANTPPAAPGGLAATVNGGAVTLTWSPASDAQTPSAGLTYNVRVGRAPGGGDVVSPMALASGRRLLVAAGNVGPVTSWSLHDLAPATYFWSVQAIDNAFAGSAFATEGTFVIEGTVATPPWLVGSMIATLGPVVPQPARTWMSVEIVMPSDGDARLDVVDSRGRLVTTLHSGPLDRGHHGVTWDRRTNGGLVPAGVYFLRLTAAAGSVARSIVVLP